jgi:hypothetical protein
MVNHSSVMRRRKAPAQVVSIGEAPRQRSEASRIEMEIHVQAPLLPAVKVIEYDVLCCAA